MAVQPLPSWGEMKWPRNPFHCSEKWNGYKSLLSQGKVKQLAVLGPQSGEESKRPPLLGSPEQGGNQNGLHNLLYIPRVGRNHENFTLINFFHI